MGIIKTLAMDALPAILVGLFLAYSNRRQSRRDKKMDELAAARKNESLLSMKMQFATSKLAYATAVAVKRGYANGEVEDGVEEYEKARKEYLDFLNAQAADHLAS